MLRWSSSASPIPRVGSSSRRRAQEARLVELAGEDVRPERREPQVEARAALGHQLEHRPVELDHLVLGACGSRAMRGAARETSACRARRRPTSRPSAGASGASGRRRSAGRGVCRGRRRPHGAAAEPLRPAVHRVTRLRVSIATISPPDERGADAVRGARGSCLPQALERQLPRALRGSPARSAAPRPASPRSARRRSARAPAA